MEFFEVLVRYEVALWRAVDDELARQGTLRLSQVHALRVVDRYGGRGRVQDLSDEIGITVGAASKVVDRLERDGLVLRSPNPVNRRSSLLQLTPAGRQGLAAATRVCSAALSQAVGGEDVAVVSAALRRLQLQLRASGVGRAA